MTSSYVTKSLFLVDLSIGYMRGKPTRRERKQHVIPHQHSVSLLDGGARSVASILWVEVQLLGVLKGKAGSHLGQVWDTGAVFWAPGSKKGEVEGTLQHSGQTQRDRLKGQPPRWCRHYCPCLRDIHLAPSHLGGFKFCRPFQLAGTSPVMS